MKPLSPSRSLLAHVARASLAAAATAALVGCGASAPPQPLSQAAEDPSEDVPGQVVVDFRDDVEQGDIKSLLEGVLGLSFVPSALERETKIEIARVSPGSERSVIEALRRDPRVQGAEPVTRMKALFVPNDPLFKEQWHMARVGAPASWSFSTGRGVTVAVVDTGIACENHGDFSKVTDLAQTECVTGYNFVAKNDHANDDQGHGTHVAGTIAQSTNNGHGAVGVAFHARLMPVKVLNENGSGTNVDVADGIRWAADHGAQVINLSLGGPRPSKVLEDAVNHARSKGAVVIAAAGNSGGSVGYPAATPGVVAVSATDQNDKLASFSSRGPEVDIAAPGVAVIQQTICNGGKGKCERFPAFNGTSMATPHVAGVAAQIVSMGVTDPDAIERSLQRSARVVDSSDGAKKLYGAGILSASRATQTVSVLHALVRFVVLAALAGWGVFSASRLRKRSVASVTPGLVLGGLLTTTGLAFFLPWLGLPPSLAIEALSRPIGDLDLLVSASLHGYLPLAHVGVPLAATLLLFGIKPLRPLLAGLSFGTAAYLVSVAVLREVASPFGAALLTAWCALNALGSAALGRFLLSQED